MTTPVKALFLLIAAAIPAMAYCQAASRPLDVRWNEGAIDCAATPQVPLQVHAYDPRTFILRQSPCADFEANFLYLLLGSERALLIDTGAVEDPLRMPLAETVLELLPDSEGGKLPLLIAHSHSHRDHRNGDRQFASVPDVRIVPADLDGVREFFGFPEWPEGVARLDLGGRIVDVLPAPGHHPNHLVFYDETAGLLFSGDFLLPGRLLIDDAAAYQASAVRIIEFLEERPVTHVLGGHVELDTGGRAYARGARHHPDERPLELGRDDLLALPAALEGFNGFHARHPNYILSNPVRNLLALAVASVVGLALVIWGLWVLLRRRRRRAA